MARLGITYEDVAQAAEKLLQEQQNPTIENVRMLLGRTGSYTTLSKYLNAWRSQRILSITKEAPQKPLPPDPVSQAVDQVWEQLNTQAAIQTEKFKQAWEEKLTCLKNENQELTEKNESLEQLLDKAEISINHLETELELVKKELIEERHQRIRAEERAQNKEDAFTQFQAETHTRVAELQKAYGEALQQLNRQLETVQNTHKNDMDQWKTLTENQRTGFMVKLDELKTAKEKAEKAQVKAETELNQQRSLTKELEEQLRTARFDLKTGGQRAQEAERQLAVSQAEITIKNKSIGEWQKKFEQAKEEIGGLKAKIKVKK